MFRKTAPSAPPAKPVITDSAPCEKLLALRVEPHTLLALRAAVVGEFQKEATLPGFRKGKAPVDLIERQHGEAIQQETVSRATRHAIEGAAKAHELKPVGPFEVRAAEPTPEGGLRVEATVEVEPDFALAAYKGLAVKPESEAVTPEELEKALASLQESMAELTPGEEGKPKEKRVPALDDELAKDMGLKTLQELKDHVEPKLREQKRSAHVRAKEAALSEELLKRHAFQLPPRLVSHQTERLTRDFKVRLLLSGMAEDKANEEAAKFTEQLRTSAERHVRLSFILDRIADQERIDVTQEELVQRLWQLARRWQKDPAEVRKTLDAQQLWPSVVSAIRQEKTMALLLSAAVVENGGTA